MIRGIYTNGWAMMANNKKMEVVTNNIANYNTNGYKRDVVVFEGFEAYLTKSIDNQKSKTKPLNNIGTMVYGSDIGEIFTDHAQGENVRTDNMLDVAISADNNAFFTLMVTDGEGSQKEYYTRNGAFRVGPTGYLESHEGFTVMGENGKIHIGTEKYFIDGDGTVKTADTVLGKIKLSVFKDTRALQKSGDNLYTIIGNDERREFKGKLMQGFIEYSNTELMRDMIDMIEVLRTYEANQKALKTQDEMLGKAVNEVGVLR
jgi:flagellar basal-body rod protein FlgF